MRRSPLDFRLSNGRTVGKTVFQPLNMESMDLTVVDAGARNGMFLLPREYSHRAELIAFEPNPVEYRKLLSGDTDATRAGMRQPSFRNTRYVNSALWDENCQRPFYVTAGPGACTLMGETNPEVTKHLFQAYPPTDPRSGKSFEELHGRVQTVIPTTCCRLDSLIESDRTIDLLKLDVEGAELRILKGADKILQKRRVLFIYTEFVAFPYYQEHPVFGDLHVFLRDHGFRLIGLDLDHAPYARMPSRLGPASDRKLLHAGDAFFILDPDRVDLSPHHRQRLAAIAAVFWFNSLAISLLQEAGLNSESDIFEIEAALRRPPLKRWLKHNWESLPRSVLSFARRTLGSRYFL